MDKNNYLEELFINEAKPALSRHGGAGGGSGGSYIEKYLEGSTTEVVLPNATKIKNWAFYYHRDLTKISMPNVKEIGYSAFYNCSNLELTELPSSLERIMNGAFYNCYSLTITKIPSSVTFIDHIAFQGCSGITTLTFKGKPNTIEPTAFSGCDNLTTINVPWAEGEVANAPWNATNATINYNYTGKVVTTEDARGVNGTTGETWTITTYEDGTKEAELVVNLRVIYNSSNNIDAIAPTYVYSTYNPIPEETRYFPTGLSKDDNVEIIFMNSSDGRSVIPGVYVDDMRGFISCYNDHIVTSPVAPEEGDELTITFKIAITTNK